MAFPPGLGIRILGSESTGREKMLEEETPTEGQVRIGGWVQLRARRSQALIVSPWFRRRGASRGPGGPSAQGFKGHLSYFPANHSLEPLLLSTDFTGNTGLEAGHSEK